MLLVVVVVVVVVVRKLLAFNGPQDVEGNVYFPDGWQEHFPVEARPLGGTGSAYPIRQRP